MNDLTVIFQMAFVLAVTVVPFVIAVRIVAGREDFGFDSIMRYDATLPWPKGVQEEEPQPWNLGPAFA